MEYGFGWKFVDPDEKQQPNKQKNTEARQFVMAAVFESYLRTERIL